MTRQFTLREPNVCTPHGFLATFICFAVTVLLCIRYLYFVVVNKYIKSKLNDCLLSFLFDAFKFLVPYIMLP